MSSAKWRPISLGLNVLTHFCCALFHFVLVIKSSFFVALYVLYLFIFFRVTSLAYDCPSASEATLKNMGESITTKHKKAWIARIIIGMCWTIQFDQVTVKYKIHIYFYFLPLPENSACKV